MNPGLQLTLNFNQLLEGTHKALWMGAGLLLILMLLDLGTTALRLLNPFLGEAPASFSVADGKIFEEIPAYETLDSGFQTRPLFQWPSDVVVQPTVQGSSMDEELSRYELAGILMGQKKQALFRDRTSSKTLFLGEGQNLGSLEIIGIKAKSVTVRSGSEEKEIILEK